MGKRIARVIVLCVAFKGTKKVNKVSTPNFGLYPQLLEEKERESAAFVVLSHNERLKSCDVLTKAQNKE